MAITVKLFTQIVAEMIGWMQVHAPEIDDYNDGSIVKSEIEALALQLDYANLQIENAQSAAAILTASGVDLDLKVADYGIKRKEAVAATGQVRFTLTSAAPIGGFTIQKGTIVSTPPAFNPYSAVSFETTADLVIPAGQTVGTISAIAQVAGVASNQPIAAIIVLTTAITGIQLVTNTTPFTGGADAESDTSLRGRGIAAFTGTITDKAESFESAASGVTGILSASAAGYGDPVMARDNGQGGKVDIYYQGTADIEIAIENFSYTPIVISGDLLFSPYVYAPPTFNTLRNIPVTSITEVYNVTTSVVIPAGQYTLVNDTSAAFGGSDRAQDTLHWLSTSGLTAGDIIRVTFTYNAMVGAARAAAEQKRGVTVDLLVKPGIPVPVNISITVNAKSVAAIPSVQAQLPVVLTALLSTKLLNQDLLQSAVVQKVLQTANVQNLFLPIDLLSTGVSGTSDIIVDKVHYIVPGTVQVNVLPPLTIQ